MGPRQTIGVSSVTRLGHAHGLNSVRLDRAGKKLVFPDFRPFAFPARPASSRHWARRYPHPEVLLACLRRQCRAKFTKPSTCPPFPEASNNIFDAPSWRPTGLAFFAPPPGAYVHFGLIDAVHLFRRHHQHLPDCPLQPFIGIG